MFGMPSRECDNRRWSCSDSKPHFQLSFLQFNFFHVRQEILPLTHNFFFGRCCSKPIDGGAKKNTHALWGFRKPEIRWKRRPKQRQQQHENVLKRTRDWVWSGVKRTTTNLEAEKNRQKRRRQEKRSKILLVPFYIMLMPKKLEISKSDEKQKEEEIS